MICLILEMIKEQKVSLIKFQVQCLVQMNLCHFPNLLNTFSLNFSSIQHMDFDVMVFDTAPTGHTLIFSNFLNIFEKGLNKILILREEFSRSIMDGMSGLFGSKQQFDSTLDKMFTKMQTLKESSHIVNEQMKNHVLIIIRLEQNNFIAVCIPEFLPMYKTQGLIQQLTKFQIDIRNIVINQVLYPEDQCRMCRSRSKMQKKYFDQIIGLYDDFHITIMPLQEQEVRGAQLLKNFSQLLLQDHKPPAIQDDVYLLFQSVFSYV